MYIYRLYIKMYINIHNIYKDYIITGCLNWTEQHWFFLTLKYGVHLIFDHVLSLKNTLLLPF